MKLWRTLLRRQEIARYSIDQYAADLTFAFQGQRYTLAGSSGGWSKTEDIEHSFSSYVSSFYKSNGIVFSIILARMLLFTEARFCWFDVGDNGEDGKAAGREGLEVLERPWPNAGTGELLARMEQDVSLGGNFFAAREETRLRRLRPDWLTIVLSAPPAEAVESDVVGYWYHPGRSYMNAGEPSPTDMVYLPDEICHWSPIPDPEAQYRGMSWLTPVVREVMGDKAATEHKLNFFNNGATLGAIIAAKENLTPEQFTQWMANFNSQHQGVNNAYRPLFFASPVDVTVTSADMRQLDFKVTQGAGETRLCAAGGVPPIIVGLSEGLSSATYSNYGMARRKFGDHWGRPQWRSASSALSTVVEPPREDLRLGVNTSGIAFLREDAKDQAEIDQIKASTVSTLVTTGFEPDTVKQFIESGDWSVLKHTGLTSVQLVPPGQQSESTDFGALRDEPVRAIAEVDEDAIIARAIAEAIDLVRGKYDVRVPAGNKGGGRFRKLSDRVFEALTDWVNGGEDDDPLDEFNREQLRKVAKELADKARAEGDHDRADRLTMRRGASSDEIKLALYKDIRASRRDTGQSTPVDKQQAARDRQARIDAAKGVAKTLAEVDKLRGDEANPSVVERRLRNSGVPPETVAELVDAYKAGDVNPVLERLAAEHGLSRRTGPAGALEPFDPAQHQALGDRPQPGQMVSVIRPGYDADVDGETVHLSKADVEVATPEEVAADRTRRVAKAKQRIRDVYAARPKAPGGWVGLADLRADLADMPREDVDAALRELSREKGIRLDPFDNTRSLGQKDRDAALDLGSSPRHMIAIDSKWPGWNADATPDEVADHRAKQAPAGPDFGDIVSDASLTPRQKRMRLRKRGLPEDQVDALVPLKVSRSSDLDGEDPDEAAEEEDDGGDIGRAVDGDEFEHYWTTGKGLARWAEHPHPWRRLRALLRKHPQIHDPEGLASRYFHKVFGIWPGERKGDNPVGPG